MKNEAIFAAQNRLDQSLSSDLWLRADTGGVHLRSDRDAGAALLNGKRSGG